jgi:hypothetical protein
MERDQILFCFSRFFLDHVRKAKKLPTAKAKMHTNTIPAMAPELNDDVERVSLFCDKGASEDVGEDEVREDVDADEAGGVEEVEGVDIRDNDEALEEMIVLVIEVVVVLVRLLDCEVVECEGFDVDRISKTVTVARVGSPVLFPSLLFSSKCQTAMSPQDQCAMI